MDKFTLINAFLTGERIWLPLPGGGKILGIIESMEREDGSGFNFNVRLYGQPTPFFVRCVRP